MSVRAHASAAAAVSSSRARESASVGRRLRGDVDMRQYVPEVMRMCARLRITERPWLDEDPTIAERVAVTVPSARSVTTRNQTDPSAACAVRQLREPTA